jgi:hypothetical protein
MVSKVSAGAIIVGVLCLVNDPEAKRFGQLTASKNGSLLTLLVNIPYIIFFMTQKRTEIVMKDRQTHPFFRQIKNLAFI